VIARFPFCALDYVMPDERETARKWISHLEAASAQAQEAADKEAQKLIDELVNALKELCTLPKPP
jgi:hypothetical protein